MSKLVIVESSSKAKTIRKILGDGYDVVASNGHVIDLPKTKMGVDIENDFKTEYVIDKNKSKIVKDLKDRVKKASEVYLASDPDREGEAISFFLSDLLGINSGKTRIEFNEITSKAVKNAISSPREIDMKKVNAQQTRRILDRLVGYSISPLLWKKLGYSTSAGRVQSVALKLICKLEDEIKKFVPEKYWTADGFFEGIKLSLFKINDKKADRVSDRKSLSKLEEMKGEIFATSSSIKKKLSSPSLPFKTSTLQQTASTELSFSPSRTMRIAQNLYSGIDINGSMTGLITYMRTDSTRISDDAREEARSFITKEFGKNYHQRRGDKKDKKAQDAHEAIRPTTLSRSPDSIRSFLKSEEYKLYKLIYNRFLASQMSDMKYDQLEVIADREGFAFKSLFNKITFDGYFKIYPKSKEDYLSEFPKIKSSLALDELEIKENQTKPPARFTEASLIKKLEKEGIGRPSTFTTIVETLKSRDYVSLEEKKFQPTPLGYAVKDILDENFPNIMNVKFTSDMESNLDDIEEDKKEWLSILKEFYKGFEQNLEKFKNKLQEDLSRKIDTDLKCEDCGLTMQLKRGRFGPYVECENKHKKSVPSEAVSLEEEKEGFVHLANSVKKEQKRKEGVKTDVKISGKDAVLKQGPYGHYLEAEIDGKKVRQSIPKNLKLDLNSNFVELAAKLDIIKKEREAIEKKAAPCEKCESKMMVREGKWGIFLSCSSYPKCKNIRKYSKNGQ
ncbi:MAG TPA: type I DNA topoisomerase [Fusobacteria bacterium]|nr:type I DNA topoisomerase [Fusobacteriota bacterium]|tara:strand:+ start:12833 stop:15025 length:2193 start_codon:yes stop_codon:yes gene_type:complete